MPVEYQRIFIPEEQKAGEKGEAVSACEIASGSFWFISGCVKPAFLLDRGGKDD